MSYMLHRAVFVGLGSLLSLSYTGARADQSIFIGTVNPLTGASSHLGKDTENGARLAVEEINAKGLTIRGEKINLVLDGQDDAADPRQAVQIAQKLVDGCVVAIVGHM